MGEKKKRQIFRQAALERLSSPEQLDQSIRFVSPQDWLILIGLGGIVTLGVCWSIWGRIPITVSGKGVLLNPRQVVPFQSPNSGQLTTLDIKDGDCIKKGDIIATINPAKQKQELQQQRDKLAQIKQQFQNKASLREQRNQLEIDAIIAQKTSLKNKIEDLTSLNPKLKQESTKTLAEQRRYLEKSRQDTQSFTPLVKEQKISAIASKRLSLQQQLKDIEKLVPLLEKRYKKQQELQKEGALSDEVVLRAEQDYLEMNQKKSDVKAQLKQLDVDQAEVEQQYLDNLNRITELEAQLQELKKQETELQQKYRDNLNSVSQLKAELEELETRSKRVEQENIESTYLENNQIQETQQAIARLEKEVSDNSIIKSSQAGCILEISASVGQYVNPGTNLGTLQRKPDADHMMAVTYFAVEDGKKIQPGMRILITPDTVKPERFGGIIGQITDISTFPVTSQGVASLIGHPEMAKKLIGQEGGKLEILAKLESDPQTFSGYKWSSSTGPQLNISSGTTTTVKVIIEERTPISFILPIIREWTGVH
ncbi:MAG TPA: NHLP bacteriocin system secretion protein [Cyanothece sp. UBA12306]|nr:NHLP bacteriocin system secretion protein [Cyanothece sp. UBA12306]